MDCHKVSPIMTGIDIGGRQNREPTRNKLRANRIHRKLPDWETKRRQFDPKPEQQEAY